MKSDSDDISKMTDILLRASAEIGWKLGHREIRLFQDYARELHFWNAKTNLVSLKSPLDLPVKHFVDSLTAADSLVSRTGHLLDMGSGAGFPGIPLKIVFPSLNVTLLDASRKRTSFLRAVVRRLELGGTIVVNQRAELLLADETFRNRFDTVISRAALKLPDFLRLGSPFLAPGGLLIAMKGPGFEAEMEASLPLRQGEGMNFSGSRDILLPLTGDFRKILIFQKA
jgi:16S rRNA (guanine527-N7)-methyltransferase